MTFSVRFQAAARACSIHLVCTLGVVLLAAFLVFGLWYQHPYGELSGGRELFWLVIAVDVVCGPLLTAVIFNPAKPRAELWRDIGLVVLIQLAALGYGLSTVWEARPLFLVMERDRFKVVAAPDLRGASLDALPAELQPQWYLGPVTVAVRGFKDNQEQQSVLFESLQGGRDIGERPDFYLPYEGEAAGRSWTRAKPLDGFLSKYPDQKAELAALSAKKSIDPSGWGYVPVVGRQDWIAVIDKTGQIQGFLKGDGF